MCNIQISWQYDYYLIIITVCLMRSSRTYGTQYQKQLAVGMEINSYPPTNQGKSQSYWTRTKKLIVQFLVNSEGTHPDGKYKIKFLPLFLPYTSCYIISLSRDCPLPPQRDIRKHRNLFFWPYLFQVENQPS